MYIACRQWQQQNMHYEKTPIAYQLDAFIKY